MFLITRKRVLLTCIACLTLIVLDQLAARLIPSFPIDNWEPVPFLGYQFHPPKDLKGTYGYEKQGPLLLFDYETKVSSVWERVNRLFPDARLISEKKADELRVVVLGGSVSLGTGASSATTRWTHLLASKLEKELKKKVTVIRLAQSGFVTTQERLTWYFAGDNIDADVVLTLNGFNDSIFSALGVLAGDPYTQVLEYSSQRLTSLNVIE